MFCLKNNYAYQAMLFPSRSRNTLRWFCLMNNSAQNNHPLFFLFFAGDANGCVYAPASEKSQSSKLQSGVHFYCRAYASLQLFLPLDTHTVYRVDPPPWGTEGLVVSGVVTTAAAITVTCPRYTCLPVCHEFCCWCHFCKVLRLPSQPARSR